VLITANQDRLKGSEVKLLSTILAASIDSGRETARLSINEFSRGYDDERGFIGRSGLSRSSVQKALVRLLDEGIIVRHREKAQDAYEYKIVPEAL